MPSVQEAVRVVPLLSKDSCFAGRVCSRRNMTFMASFVLTILMSSSLRPNQ